MPTSLESRILVIIAGGAASRIQQPKALLPIGKQTLLAYMVTKLSANFAQVYVSSSTNYLAELPHLADLWTSQLGPVSAIVSSTIHLQANFNYRLTFVPVDMPYLNSAVLDKLISTDDASISYFKDSPLPLEMYLSSQIIDYVHKVANQFNDSVTYSVKKFIAGAPVSANVIELVEYDCLKNINYPQEWEEFCHENSM